MATMRWWQQEAQDGSDDMSARHGEGATAGVGQGAAMARGAALRSIHERASSDVGGSNHVVSHGCCRSVRKVFSWRQLAS